MLIPLGLWLAVVGCRPGEGGKAPANGLGQPPVAKSEPRIYEVDGVVRELRPQEHGVVIQHEEIPGYMMAMTMPFEVKDTNELAGLAAGDRVHFRMLVTEKEGWIDSIQKVGKEAAHDRRIGPREVRLVEPLKVGQTLPDYRLTNQFGQPFQISDFRGSALGITFIFTRCPFPNFCPRMSGNFADVAGLLSVQPDAPANWHLLSVSFDPDFDTPDVLKRYAEGYQYDPKKWTFATGDMEEIDALTEQLGVMFGREGDSISHNLRTVVIDPEGRLSLIITGNVWRVEEFLDAMVRAAGRVGDRAGPDGTTVDGKR